MASILSAIPEDLLDKILIAAKEQKALVDLRLMLKHATVRNTREVRNPDYHIQRLIQHGLIKNNDGYLSFGSLNDDFIKSLEDGDKKSWSIADEYFSENKKIKKFDSDELSETGLLGEKAVINRLREELDEFYHQRIDHVSKYDDSAGYDIRSPSLKDPAVEKKLEVKTTKRPGNNFRFYLSRNEYEVASINPDRWHLVLVQKQNDEYVILGNIKLIHFIDWIPEDSDDRCRWESISITIKTESIQKTLP